MTEKRVAFYTSDGCPIHYGDFYYYIGMGHGRVWKLYSITVTSPHDFNKGIRQFAHRKKAEDFLDIVKSLKAGFDYHFANQRLPDIVEQRDSDEVFMGKIVLCRIGRYNGMGRFFYHKAKVCYFKFISEDDSGTVTPDQFHELKWYEVLE